MRLSEGRAPLLQVDFDIQLAAVNETGELVEQLRGAGLRRGRDGRKNEKEC